MRRRFGATEQGRRGCLGRLGLGCGGLAVLLVVVAVAASLAGGGGDDDPTPTTASRAAPTERPQPTETPEPTDEPEPTETPDPTEAPASRCEEVAPELVEAIATGLTVEGGSLRNAAAVRSGDHERAWFVAADVQGEGLGGGDDIGVWATNSLTAGEGLIYAVDAVANEFSDWGDGRETDARLSMDDDGAREAAACVGAGG